MAEVGINAQGDMPEKVGSECQQEQEDGNGAEREEPTATKA